MINTEDGLIRKTEDPPRDVPMVATAVVVAAMSHHRYLLLVPIFIIIKQRSLHFALPGFTGILFDVGIYARTGHDDGL